jgi:hypothetical protein
MPTESRNGLSAGPRWALTIAGALATVVLLLLVYRLTTPRSDQTTTAGGKRIADSDVLQVGALPVT